MLQRILLVRVDDIFRVSSVYGLSIGCNLDPGSCIGNSADADDYLQRSATRPRPGFEGLDKV